MKTIDECKAIKNNLRQKRSTFYEHWRDLAEQLLPRHARFMVNDRTRAGTKRNDKILNSTPTKAARIESSGMAAAITSPIRIWFRMGVSDAQLMKNAAVQSHMLEVEKRMRAVMSGSNFYNGMGDLYLSLVVFGTSAMFIDEDPFTVIRVYPLMTGSYYLESSDRLQVDTVYRDVSMTVKQMIQKFGKENCSKRVQDMAREKKLYEYQDVVHVVEPNQDYVGGMLDYRGKEFISYWYEDRGEDNKKFLRISGYNEFPVIAPRWHVTAEDVYGSCPAMDALGDCRMLQKMESQKLKNFDKATDPSLVAPTSLKNQRTSLLPGDITYSDTIRENSLRPIQDPDSNARAFQVCQAEIREVESRIKGVFSNEIWLMMQRQPAEGVQPDTARAVDEKHEEKMLQLGPTLSRLDGEGLDPAIRRIYNVMFRANLFPPLPPELRDQKFEAKYINIMAQAQKLLETTGVERLAAFVSGLQPVFQEARDVVDIDNVVREYADMLGVNPDMLFSEAQVKKVRNQKAAMAQQQQVAAGANQGSQTAKNLSQVPMNQDTGLTRLMQQFAQGSVPTIPGVQ
jgi:hypothetical protein